MSDPLDSNLLSQILNAFALIPQWTFFKLAKQLQISASELESLVQRLKHRQILHTVKSQTKTLLELNPREKWLEAPAVESSILPPPLASKILHLNVSYDRLKAIVTYLADHPQSSNLQIRTALQLSRDTVKRVLNELIRVEKVRKQKADDRSEYTYTLISHDYLPLPEDVQPLRKSAEQILTPVPLSPVIAESKGDAPQNSIQVLPPAQEIIESVTSELLRPPNQSQNALIMPLFQFLQDTAQNILPMADLLDIFHHCFTQIPPKSKLRNIRLLTLTIYVKLSELLQNPMPKDRIASVIQEWRVKPKDLQTCRLRISGVLLPYIHARAQKDPTSIYNLRQNQGCSQVAVLNAEMQTKWGKYITVDPAIFTVVDRLYPRFSRLFPVHTLAERRYGLLVGIICWKLGIIPDPIRWYYLAHLLHTSQHRLMQTIQSMAQHRCFTQFDRWLATHPDQRASWRTSVRILMKPKAPPKSSIQTPSKIIDLFQETQSWTSKGIGKRLKIRPKQLGKMRKMLERLVAAGLLQKTKIGRCMVYRRKQSIYDKI